MCRIRSRCCARAVSGTAAAPLNNTINSRRLIPAPKVCGHRNGSSQLTGRGPMSTLGYQRTLRQVHPMSALPRIVPPLRWPDHETAEALFAAFGHPRAGHLQCLAYCLCYLRICGPQAAMVCGFGCHLWRRGIHCPAAYRSHGSQDPPAQAGAKLHNYRRRVARRPRQSRAHRHASTAARCICNRRLVGGRPVGAGKLVAHGPGIRIQLALPDRPVQHALPFRTRPGCRLPEGN